MQNRLSDITDLCRLQKGQNEIVLYLFSLSFSLPGPLRFWILWVSSWSECQQRSRGPWSAKAGKISGLSQQLLLKTQQTSMLWMRILTRFISLNQRTKEAKQAKSWTHLIPRVSQTLPITQQKHTNIPKPPKHQYRINSGLTKKYLNKFSTLTNRNDQLTSTAPQKDPERQVLSVNPKNTSCFSRRTRLPAAPYWTFSIDMGTVTIWLLLYHWTCRVSCFTQHSLQRTLWRALGREAWKNSTSCAITWDSVQKRSVQE